MKMGRYLWGSGEICQEYFQNESTEFASRRSRGKGFEKREARGSQL